MDALPHMLHVTTGLPQDMSHIERHVLVHRECKSAIGPASGVGEYRENENLMFGSESLLRGGYSARCCMNGH
jgi:hypothetical protein